jgi:hypothetical protein
MKNPEKIVTATVSSDGDSINRLQTAAIPAIEPSVEKHPIPDPDPFDPASIVLDQSYLKEAAATRALLEVSVRKPKEDEFFRVHTDPTYSLGPIATIKDSEGRETYILSPSLAKAERLKHAIVTFHTCINTDGVIFLWPVTVPGSSGRSANAWHTSAVKAKDQAELKWIKLVASQNAGNYEAWPARGEIPEPDWPALSFKEILKLALKDRYITSRDHPVLQKKDGIL